MANRSQVYMVMEWVEGRLLRKILIESRKLPMPERAIKIAIAWPTRWTTFTATAWCIAI